MRRLVSSATAVVWARVAPGASERYTCVCELSSGGMKPVLSSGIIATEAKKNRVASTMVLNRCRMHHPTIRM